MVERRATSTDEFIWVGLTVLALGGAVAAIILTKGSDSLAWLGWTVAGVAGLAGQTLLLIGVVAKGVEVGSRG